MCVYTGPEQCNVLCAVRYGCHLMDNTSPLCVLWEDPDRAITSLWFTATQTNQLSPQDKSRIKFGQEMALKWNTITFVYFRPVYTHHRFSLPHPTPPPPYLLKMHDEQKMLVLFKIIFQVLIPACIGIETLEKQTSDCMDNLVT